MNIEVTLDPASLCKKLSQEDLRELKLAVDAEITFRVNVIATTFGSADIEFVKDNSLVNSVKYVRNLLGGGYSLNFCKFLVNQIKNVS